MEVRGEVVVPRYQGYVFNAEENRVSGSRVCHLGDISWPGIFSKKLLDNTEHFSGYWRMSRHVFMAQVHFKLAVEEAVEVTSNHTHWYPCFNSIIPRRSIEKSRDVVTRYTCTTSTLGEHTEM